MARFTPAGNLAPMDESTLFSQPTTEYVVLRLRKLRKERGWTLHDVEDRTEARIKAVVLGSYERGSRSLSLAKTIELANLFAIPVSELLQEPRKMESLSVGESAAHVFDLRHVQQLARTSTNSRIQTLQKFLVGISQRRCDWNGEVLTLRINDLDTLTLLLEMDIARLRLWFAEEKLVLQSIR